MEGEAVHWQPHMSVKSNVLVLLILLVALSACNFALADEKTEWLFKSLNFSTHDYMLRLLDEGVDVNARDSRESTPLIEASFLGSYKKATILIERGARVNAQDQDGMTPLMWASSSREPSIVKLLLTNKADVNARDKRGRTALFWTCTDTYKAPRFQPVASMRINEGIEVMKMLLKSGADINAQDCRGRTALMEASLSGSHHTVSQLLAEGANVNIKDKEGNTALSLLMKTKGTRFSAKEELLMRYGAKE